MPDKLAWGQSTLKLWGIKSPREEKGMRRLELDMRGQDPDDFAKHLRPLNT